MEYRITTVGMVQLPIVEKPTGYAMQEGITLDHCEGEGAARSCRLHHRFLQFEAEPPAGKFMQSDHDRVAEVKLSHALHADGSADAPTEVSGRLGEGIGDALTLAHAFYCIQLPAEPVAVGATWTSTCRSWARGALATRELTWTLAKLEDDPESGQRAELRYQGRYAQPAPDGERVGTVQGILYFFVEAGQPHLLREQIALPLKAGGATTKTTVNVQFARVDSADPEALLRTDGKPFPEVPPASPTAPAGADATDAGATEPEGGVAAPPAR